MRTMLLAALLACGSDKSEAPPDLVPVATRAVKQIAFEAYPDWAMKHVDKACPDRIDDLTSTPDPWGHPYRMFCGKTLPPGARGLAVVSDGSDGKPDSADDIKSWP